MQETKSTSQAGERTQYKTISELRELGVKMCILKSALVILEKCRAKCPGIGGDIDASNLRFMIEKGEPTDGAIKQAARCLQNLSEALEIDAENEVRAMWSIAQPSNI